jgi:hypothetical protein
VLKTPMNYINSVKPCQGRVKKIKIPTTDLKGAKPYLGRLKNVVHYGIVYGNQLRIWMLNESCAHIEWLLKYEVDIFFLNERARTVPISLKEKKLYKPCTPAKTTI